LAAAYFAAAAENILKLGEYSIAFNKSCVPPPISDNVSLKR